MAKRTRVTEPAKPVRAVRVPVPAPVPEPSLMPAAGNQQLLHALGLRARLSVSQPGDPDEHEADRIADDFVRGASSAGARSASPPGAALQRKCNGCDDDGLLARKAESGAALAHPVARTVTSAIGASRGVPLPRSLRGQYERFFGTGLAQVRVHTDSAAQQATRAVAAQAFTRGHDIYFGAGRYAPEQASGRHLLAHELAHATQGPARTGRLRRQAAPAPNPAGTDELVRAVRDDQVDGVVARLERRTPEELRALRDAVEKALQVRLERWLLARRNRGDLAQTVSTVVTIAGALTTGGASLVALPLQPRRPATSGQRRAEEGIRLLWPVLPLIDRLELYDEGWRELEQAQLDVIRSATGEQRREAAGQGPRLEAVYARMEVPEEYEARLLIAPDQRYEAVARLVDRAPGVFSDEEDLVFKAIFDLDKAQRRKLYDAKLVLLYRMLSNDQLALLRTLSYGTEAEALVARLKLATEGRIDDKEALKSIVDRAVALVQEQKTLRATIANAALPPGDREEAQKRLDEIGELEALLRFGTGPLDPKSFLGQLSEAAGGADEFGALARQLGATITDPAARRAFALRVAKQRILMSTTLGGATGATIKSALVELRAPPLELPPGTPADERERKQQAEDVKLREELLRDPEVEAVLKRLTAFDRSLVEKGVHADAFDQALAQLAEAHQWARWGEFFRLVIVIARREGWRLRFRETATDPWGVYAKVREPERGLMEEILQTQRVPVARVLGYSKGDVELLRIVLAEMEEAERAALRLGYVLARENRTPANDEETKALQAFRTFEAQLQAAQTTARVHVDRAGIAAVLEAALGTAPTQAEFETPQGRHRAVALMYHLQQERLGLDRGLAQGFTETDETMVAAAREFAARWLPLRDTGQLTTVEFAVFADLHERFLSRGQEFTQASNKVGEMAGMVAATVAGIVVVAATGGAATPGVIAIAAAAGAGARVLTREMIQSEYYDTLSAEGGRDALIGAIDGALAVVGASLAARGAELLGLGGRALTQTAARIGGEVAERASVGLRGRVLRGAVEGAIDGAFSGAVSEAVNAFTDNATWRRGVWQGLVRVGQAALLGGLVGLAGGSLVGGALPVLGAGLRSASDRLLAGSVERALDRAGATRTLDAARRAMRAGDAAEARRLFGQIERHLTPEQANLVWRDLAHLLDNATRLEQAVTLLGERHTLKLVQGERGAFFVLCSWCTKVRDILAQALDILRSQGAEAARISRLEAMIKQVEAMEANIAARGGGKEDTNTMRALLGMLSEGEGLIGAGLRELPPRRSINFGELARDPAVARRASELYEGYLQQLWELRKDIFRGRSNRDALTRALEEEAQMRALNQALRESPAGAPLELAPGAPARARVDPATDFPFGFYDRAGFDRFSRRLYGQVPADAQLVVEGSSVTGRRFDRLVDNAPTGAPFGLNRFSDYDVAIVSGSLFDLAKSRGVKLAGDGSARTLVLTPAELQRLGLGDLNATARQAILDATGIAYPVRFKIYGQPPAGDAARLPLPR